MKWRNLIAGVMLVCCTAHASVLDEIAQLEAWKEKDNATNTTIDPPKAKPTNTARFYRLPDGTQINQGDYRIVLFMQASCKYCQQFDPLLFHYSSQSGFRVFPYTLDGQGDAHFPDAIPAPQSVLEAFFGPGQKPVTPSTYLINVHTLETWPLAQGIIDIRTLQQRIDQSLLSRKG